MATTRIYVVRPKSTAAPASAARLVEAPTRNTALRHVAQDTLHAENASQADLVKLVAAGVKVEKASGGDDGAV